MRFTATRGERVRAAHEPVREVEPIDFAGELRERRRRIVSAALEDERIAMRAIGHYHYG
jgi:hypothetical protein